MKLRTRELTRVGELTRVDASWHELIRVEANFEDFFWVFWYFLKKFEQKISKFYEFWKIFCIKLIFFERNYRVWLELTRVAQLELIKIEFELIRVELELKNFKKSTRVTGMLFWLTKTIWPCFFLLRLLKIDQVIR